MQLALITGQLEETSKAPPSREGHFCLSGLASECLCPKGMEGGGEQGHSVWLPEEVEELILAWLPAVNLVRLRLVCKRWHALTSSRAFLRLRAQKKPAADSWALVFDHMFSGKGVLAWRPMPTIRGSSPSSSSSSSSSSGGGVWQQLPLQFLPSHLSLTFLVAAGGGILCLINSAGLITVCNPLTRTWRQLPPPNQRRNPPLMMGVLDEPQRGGYQVLIVGGSCAGAGAGGPAPPVGFTHAIELFDSAKERWTVVGRLPDGVMPKVFKIFGPANLVHCNGVFYCVTWHPHLIMGFHMRRRVWVEIALPLELRLHHIELDTHLVERNGQLLLVAPVKRKYGWAVKVWGLCRRRAPPPPPPPACLPPDDPLLRVTDKNVEWREVARMPPDRTALLFGANGHGRAEGFECAGYGNRLIFTSPKFPSCLTLDLKQRVWEWMEELPRGVQAPWFSLTFQPRLDATL